MTKTTILTLLIILLYTPSFAQAPNAIPYQAVARNASGNLIANQLISVRFSIHDVSAAGTVVYRETHSTTTNMLGLFSVNVGQGTPSVGTFATINWAVNAKFLQVEFDSSGGSSYTNMGTQQMLSVPYALLAGKSSDLPSGNLTGNTLRWNGTAWVVDSTLTNKGSNVGVGTSSPDNSSALEINSTTKGLLLPRMTTAQREAIVNPAPGLIIYNTDNNCLDLRTPASWMSFCSSVCTPMPTTALAGNDQNPFSGPVTLAANTPVFGTGTWSILSGSGGSFVNNHDPGTQFTGSEGVYTLQWQISTVCGNSVDQVYITYPCPSGYGNCNGNPADGCESNLSTDLSNCGACGINCNIIFPNANGACNAGACAMTTCYPNYYDIDGNPANGCEYFCNSTGPDSPDDTFTDENCDGVDGTSSSAIFVATTGNNSNPGTRAQPKLTITNAITTAAAQGKTAIYISQGTYNERVTLTNGISLYGGYSAANNWARSTSYIVTVSTSTVVSGRVIGISGTNITSTTVIDRVNVTTGTNSSSGGSNYGVYCNTCTGLTIKNSSITSGNAAAGTAGTNGSPGASGTNGSPGNAGSCDGNGAGPVGGTGGTNGTCSRTGGAGGQAGGTTGSNNGSAGNSGVGGAGGGSGGATGDPGLPGGTGTSGASVSNGSNGTGGSGGTVTTSFWLSNTGNSGSTGPNGNGGGGGGGGGAQTGSVFIDDGYGNSGGGGGAGGCGGTFATGGTGGGGSFGIFLLNSTGITLTANTITSGNGGNGGQAGTGGTGGAGGSGGTGGTTCLSEVGRGGNGGAGSAGGNGGHGGGGAGGPSYCIYRSSTTVSTAGNTLIVGNGGTGGASLGNAGSNGASGGAF